MKKLLVFLLFICSSPNIMSQIVVDCNVPNNTANALVNILVNGVPFSNASLSGFDCSAGYFDGSNTNLDMDAGVVMCTGGLDMLLPQGIQNPEATPGDDDLELQLELVNSSSTEVNNVIILEFDFTPNSDQIAFQYVFASKEYPGFTCTNFNDIFGFFLSGPGINGPFSNNAVNIALIPDPNNPGNYTDTPVLINALNGGTPTGTGLAETCAAIDPDWESYSVFFTENNAEETVSMPGFTVPLTATANVIPCETYHIKLALANVSDDAFQSSVFLLENSFSSTSPSASYESDFSPFSGNDTTLVEGCFDGSITFELDEALDIDYVIDFIVGGSATEGTDFETMGSQAIIPSGDSEVSIPLVPFYDGIAEGNENIIINVTLSDGCEEEELEYNFTIVDRLPIYLESFSDTAFCPGDEAININPSISGGIEPMSYQWFYDGILLTNQQNITIQPENLGVYSFNAMGLCDSEISDSFETYLLEPDYPLQILSPYNSIEVCLGDELETLIQIYGGVGEPEFMWYLNGVPFNDTLNFKIPTDFAYNYNLEFTTTDECSNTESDYFSYNVVDCIKPNVFTPNADGENDFFYVNFGDVVSNVRLNIYNRWGQEVYTSINYELCDQETGAKCWNGLDMSTNDFCPEGSYFYTIEMLDGRKNKGFTSIYRD